MIRYLVRATPVEAKATHHHPTLGWVILTALSARATPGATALIVDAAEDVDPEGYTPVPPAEPKPLPVPAEVPLWAFRAVADLAGLSDAIVAAFAELEEPARTAAINLWERGNMVQRQSPTVLTLTPVLGLTSEQVDDFFRQAAALKI